MCKTVCDKALSGVIEGKAEIREREIYFEKYAIRSIISDIRNSTLPSASIRLNLFFMRIKFIIALPVIMQIITAYEMPMIS